MHHKENSASLNFPFWVNNFVPIFFSFFFFRGKDDAVFRHVECCPLSPQGKIPVIKFCKRYPAKFYSFPTLEVFEFIIINT